MNPSVPSRDAAWRYALVGLSLVGLGLAGYLGYVTASGGTALGCGPGATFDCDSVMSSRWGKWLGLPVSLPAVVVYACLVGVSLFIALKPALVPREVWLILSTLAAIAAGAALWFIALQAFVLQSLCLYCLLLHLSGLALSVVAVVLILRNREPLPGGLVLAARLVAAGALAALIIGQIAIKPKTFEVEIVEGPLTKSDDGQPAIDGGSPGTTKPKGDVPANDDVKPKEKDPLAELFPPKEKTASKDAPDTPQQPEKKQPDDDSPVNPDGLDLPPPPIEKTVEKTSITTPASSDDPPPEKAPEEGANKPSAATVEIRPEVQTPVETLVKVDAAAGRKVPILGGQVELDLNREMVIGSREAKGVAVELFDYTCPHCRALHWRLKGAKDRYGDQLALVLVPVPLNHGCNHTLKETADQHAYACLYARFAIAVWQQKPEEFAAFHTYLIEAAEPPPPGEVRYKIGKLFGPDQVDALLDDPAVNEQLARGIKLYEICKKGRIPKLVLGSALVTGKLETADEVNGLVEQHLALKPREEP